MNDIRAILIDRQNMHRSRRAKIVATVGPASASPDMLEHVLAGVDTFRLLIFRTGATRITLMFTPRSECLEKTGRPIGILRPQGPKIRVGTVRDGKPNVATGETIRLCCRAPMAVRMRYRCRIPKFAGCRARPRPVDDDGRVRVRVTGIGDDYIEAKAVVGGAFPIARASTCRARSSTSRR